MSVSVQDFAGLEAVLSLAEASPYRDVPSALLSAADVSALRALLALLTADFDGVRMPPGRGYGGEDPPAPWASA